MDMDLPGLERLPGPVRFILDRLRENRIRAVIAGGAVRDAAMGRNPSDLDILADSRYDRIVSIFSDQKVAVVGKAFPVCLVNGIEVASPRPGTGGFPGADLGRRDLTVNAMAWEPVTGRFYDPFDGMSDLKNRRIRFTRDPDARIQEDPVRMVRACRFLALINGAFETASLSAAQKNAGLMDDGAAQERSRVEILKAMTLETPSLFFNALRETGLLMRIFPSLDRCFDLDGGPHHGETVYDHCLLVGDALPADRPLLRLAGYLHDTGKFDAADIKEGRLTFYHHEEQTGAMERDLSRLRFSNQEIKTLVSLTLAHMRPLGKETTPRAARRLLAMLGELDLPWRDFLRMRLADRKGNRARPAYTFAEIRERVRPLKQELDRASALTEKDLAISGKTIMRLTGLAAGPRVGKIKKALLDQVLDDPGRNTPETLEGLCLLLRDEMQS